MWRRSSRLRHGAKFISRTKKGQPFGCPNVLMRLVDRMSLDIRIASVSLVFEASNKSGIGIHEVAGHLVIVAHVNGIDEQIVAVGGSPAGHTNIAIRETETQIAGFAAMAPDCEILRIGPAVVPANTHEATFIHSNARLVVVVTAAQTRLEIAIDLGWTRTPGSVHHRTKLATGRHRMHSSPAWRAGQ